MAGSYWGRRVENAEVSRADFLKPLNMPFRGWKTNDATLTASELNLLKPDATLVRRYTGPNKEMAEIAVIAGHRKQSVHTPGFCMVGGGWEITSQEAHTLALEASSLHLSALGIVAATSTVVYENGETPELTDFKLEGLSILNANDVAISNDNDFGIGDAPGALSRMWVIRLRDQLPLNP